MMKEQWQAMILDNTLEMKTLNCVEQEDIPAFADRFIKALRNKR